MSDFRVGDIVRYSHVFRVEAVDGEMLSGTDEKDDDSSYYSLKTSGTEKFELLHRPKIKPAVGEVLTGDKIRSTLWRRGTVVQTVEFPEFVLVLQPSGFWRNQYGASVDFNKFGTSGETFRVLYLPEEK